MEDETAERETTFGIAEEEELSAPRFAVQLERSARTADDGEGWDTASSAAARWRTEL